jgi:hypothetical protein
MNKVPKGCDQQGRFPEAAEAATEVGQEEEPNFYSKELMFEELGKFFISLCVATAVVGAIAGFVWYYVTTP